MRRVGQSDDGMGWVVVLLQPQRLPVEALLHVALLLGQARKLGVVILPGRIGRLGKLDAEEA